MAVLYSKERSKYGNLTGQIINWPVDYNGLPDDGANVNNLPAGYLKCDGTKYFATDYPQLAAVCGTGSNCKFARKNADGTNFDTLLDTQFMVPDMGSKYAEPTSGANAGVYNNIRLNNAVGNEFSRSGIGIDVEAAIGSPVNIEYSGQINVPSQEIDVKGKPSWSYAGATHYTDTEGVEENALHPHSHFHDAVRSRLLTTNELSTNQPQVQGFTGRRNATTITTQDWLDATKNNSNQPGSGQEQCRTVRWCPVSPCGTEVSTQGLGLQQTIYWGHCINGGWVPGESQYTYQCLNNDPYTLQGGNYPSGSQATGSPDGQNTAQFQNVLKDPIFGSCLSSGSGANSDHTFTVPVTYASGYPGVPLDFNNSSLHDVLPLQSNLQVGSTTVIPDVANEEYDTVDLSQPNGDPTLHSHRVDLVKGDHTYKVKTDAIVVSPENLSTTMTVGTDASKSIDSAVAPFIVMEFLIKI
tara:strand:+ start:7 stop:1410 length:1404 start_codon:yes stop_codon:yes gene_type:complete